MLSHAEGTGEHGVILLALCAVPLLIEARPCCQALPGGMEWSVVPQLHISRCFFRLSPELGFPAAHQLMLNPRGPFCP